jgi:hypothetical protein
MLSPATTFLKNSLQEQCLGLSKQVKTSRSYGSNSSFGYKHKSDTLYIIRPDLLWTFVTFVKKKSYDQDRLRLSIDLLHLT